MNGSARRQAIRILIFGSLISAPGCGNYSSPSAPDSSSTTPGPDGASIAMTSSGVTPNAVTITAGQSVTFVNNDSVAHEIVSGPVPTYDGCPAVNRVGRLEPGQSMQTGALSTTRTCDFVDLLRTGDPRWAGTIAVR